MYARLLFVPSCGDKIIIITRPCSRGTLVVVLTHTGRHFRQLQLFCIILNFLTLKWTFSSISLDGMGCMMMMYKIAHTVVVGDPWTEWLTTSKRVMRGFHAWKYIPIYSQHNIYKFSFLPRTIIDWNTLSPHSVDSPSIDTFRARITKN